MADTYRVQLYETLEALKCNPGGEDMSVLAYEGNKKKSHSLFVVTGKNKLLNNDFYISRTTSETYMKRSLKDS